MNKNTNVSKRKAKDKSKHKSKHKYDEFGNIITEKNTYIRGLIKRIPNIRNSIVLNKWFFSFKDETIFSKEVISSSISFIKFVLYIYIR